MIEKIQNSEDTLLLGEVHPATHNAYKFVKMQLLNGMLIESLASTALSGNRLANICMGTINRLKNNEPVSDRYILGLAWAMHNIMQESDEK